MSSLDALKTEFGDDMGNPLGGIRIGIVKDYAVFLAGLESETETDAIRGLDFSFPVQNLDFSKLERFTHLEDVRFYSCEFAPNDRSLETLPGFASLMFDRCKGPLDLQTLSHRLSKLTSLDICNSEVVSVVGLENLRDLTYLRLWFDGLVPGLVPGLRQIESLKRLETLELAIPNFDVRLLSGLPQVRSLNIGAGPIMNAISLAELDSLKWASLEGTQIRVIDGLVLQSRLSKCHFEFSWRGRWWNELFLVACSLLIPIQYFFRKSKALPISSRKRDEDEHV